MVDKKMVRYTMKQDKERLDYRCKRFNAVLNDAEHNWEIHKISTKRWLRRLKLCISDAENVIEEYNYEYIQAKEDTRSITSISDSFLSYISDKLNKMNNKFEEILEERRENYEHMDEEDGSKLPQYFRPPSSPLSDQSIIYGRDADLKTIGEMLIDSHQQRQEEDYTASIIVLVGMGGVGKTIFAQTVYKDGKINEHFDKKAWVCVSDEFVVEKITKDALVSATGKPSNLTVFSVIQEKLLVELEGKKFLLVLDDVWNEIHEFSNMLGFLRTLGVQGSKIIVTTRSKVVANIMNPSVLYNLGALNSEDAWKLFKSRAFFGSSFDYAKQVLLEVIGKKIVEKCKGLPLIIKVFADNLRDKNDDVERWKEMMEHNPLDENEILECLRLSYTNLSAELKRCFLYCSVYPKDHVFVGDELIRLWIAQGILRDEPEDEYIYVNGLLYRSFLEKNEQSDDIWGESKYTLHDIMHDLAQKILEEEHSLLSENKNKARIEPIHGRTFHRSLYPPPKDIKIECLHTHLKHLRDLTWADESLVYLPDSIGTLIHLRYLRLDTPSLVSLPESVCRLYNLRTIQCDSLEELPMNVRTLRELRHIICLKYICLPIGLGELIHLQTLPKLIVSSENEEYGGLEELKNLSMLRGSLVLYGLVNKYANEEDKMLKLYQKSDLRQLELIWFNFGENQTSTVDVLDNLKPHFNLVKLLISFYCGVVFSDWLGCPAFSNLTHITLSHCFRCETLPPMGKLKSLKELNLFKLSKLERIGGELYGEKGNRKLAFKSLEKLSINNLRKWKEWEEIDECSFPSLCELHIWECNQLQLLNVPKMFHKLQKLKVGDSDHVIDLCKAATPVIKNLYLRDKRQIDNSSPLS